MNLDRAMLEASARVSGKLKFHIIYDSLAKKLEQDMADRIFYDTFGVSHLI